MSRLRPEIDRWTGRADYSPEGGTAYLMIYNAVKTKDRLITGRLHAHGESCAVGSFYDVNPRCGLPTALVDEVAAVNDSVKNVTDRQRRLVVLRWLRWKLTQVGMPGFTKAANPLKERP